MPVAARAQGHRCNKRYPVALGRLENLYGTSPEAFERRPSTAYVTDLPSEEARVKAATSRVRLFDASLRNPLHPGQFYVRPKTHPNN